MIEVEVGDTIVEFPDGTPPDVMRGALQKRFGGGAKPVAPETPETPEGPQKPDIGQAKAAVIGLKSGVSGNWDNEIEAAQKAALAGTPLEKFGSALPLSTAIGAGRYLGERLAGQEGPATQAYNEAMARSSAQKETAREQYPGTTLAAEVVGGLAAPIPGLGAVKAATGVGRAVRSAGVGAGVGAVAGAGDGDGLADRALRAASGGAIGGVVGGAASPVLDAAARGIGTVAREAGRYLAPTVEARAARMVDNATKEAVKLDPNASRRLTAGEVANNPSAVVGDMAGEPGRAVARWAANASPEARDTLNSMIDPRFEGQAQRITGWLEKNFHYPNAHDQQKAIETVARETNKKNYPKAYLAGDREIWSPELERLTSAPHVQSAIGSAISKWKNYAVRDGYGAANPAYRIENGGLIKTGTGMKAYPNIQLWDYAARELQDAARAAPPGSQQGKLFNDLARLLKAELDKIVPQYKTARESAASFFKAENALEAGQNFVRQNFNNRDVRAQLAKMSPQERQLFQDGFVSRYIETLNATGDRRNVLNQIVNSPQAREKVEMVLGRQKAVEIEAMLRVEGIMDMARGAVQGNSTTTRQLIEAGLVGGGGLLSVYGQSWEGMGHTIIAGALAARGRNTDRRVAQRVAEMLVSRDPTQMQRGLQILARNQGLMNAIRSLDQRIGRIAAQQGTGAFQAGGVSRAEDQQPEVPRPPSQ